MTVTRDARERRDLFPLPTLSMVMASGADWFFIHLFWIDSIIDSFDIFSIQSPFDSFQKFGESIPFD